MNARQLEKLGVPSHLAKSAILGIQNATAAGELRGLDLKTLIPQIVAAPESYLEDSHFSELARELVNDKSAVQPRDPAPFGIWGVDGIDEAAVGQMKQACALPVAAHGALMADAHVGYGLPIGGVLALGNAVAPYAVGVDIACRMKLSILDLPASQLSEKSKELLFDNALEKGTRFGVGSAHEKRQEHDVMDADWTVTRVTRENKDKAWKQLGSSGSGNHFVEFGVLTLDEDSAELGLKAGEYTALLSHSGSRGAGASVCSVYSGVARAQLPKRYEAAGRLAWLDMNTEAGQEYWLAMNLMGDYAAANHDVIHRNISKLLGAGVLAVVENHHNFAWKEMHHGKELIVHRKGATPAGKGVLGVIPGSMGTPAYVVRGKGNAASLESASHGAGRAMSRTKALEKYNFRAVQKDLEKKGVRVLSAGADEVPYVYKDIAAVMDAQRDLVDTLARFDPRVVKMCGDGSKAED
jgi:tRNA-splicing ligase RtcB (3'-phosphate/5'-hydroxy nucleic acid ligase)